LGEQKRKNVTKEEKNYKYLGADSEQELGQKTWGWGSVQKMIGKCIRKINQKGKRTMSSQKNGQVGVLCVEKRHQSKGRGGRG